MEAVVGLRQTQYTQLPINPPFLKEIQMATPGDYFDAQNSYLITHELLVKTIQWVSVLLQYF
jgi:hypothetical protein